MKVKSTQVLSKILLIHGILSYLPYVNDTIDFITTFYIQHRNRTLLLLNLEWSSHLDSSNLRTMIILISVVSTDHIIVKHCNMQLKLNTKFLFTIADIQLNAHLILYFQLFLWQEIHGDCECYSLLFHVCINGLHYHCLE